MRKRKLITHDTMHAILKDTDRGVPLARAMKNNGVQMSRPAVAKLVGYYNKRSLDVQVFESLFPDWLVTDGQEQPDGMEYEGTFPLGEWVWTV